MVVREPFREMRVLEIGEKRVVRHGLSFKVLNGGKVIRSEAKNPLETLFSAKLRTKEV